MPEIPLGAVDRLLRKNGVKRVSIETSKMLREILEDLSKDIINIAISIVENRNQTMLNKDDIRLAWNIIQAKNSHDF